MIVELKLLFAFALWLWSDIIGPENSGPSGPGTGKPIAEETPAAGGSFKQKQFQVINDDAIDRNLFMVAFKRQAQIALLPCLRDFKSSPASLDVTATLTKDGHLKSVRAMRSTGGLPDCAMTAIEKMEFKSVAHTLTTNAQELVWRVDW